MNTIVVDYDPFSIESRVGIVKDGKQEYVAVSSGLENLTKDLIAIAYKYNIYEVKVSAPLATIHEIKRQVNKAEMTAYSANKIRVEVL